MKDLRDLFPIFTAVTKLFPASDISPAPSEICIEFRIVKPQGGPLGAMERQRLFMKSKTAKLRQSFSRFIAGTMTWGSWGKNLSCGDMITNLNHCLDIGITTFDHADIYGGYTNEGDFGRAFSQSGISREKVQLISKCGIQYVCDARQNRVKHYNYEKEYIISSAEQSLRNLQTDYLDLYLLHRPSPLMQPEEVGEAIEHLRRDGKILHFGLSNFTPSQVALIESAVAVEGHQVEISLTADSAMYDGTLDDCIVNGRLAMAWSPLGGYFRQQDERQERIRQVLTELKGKYEATELQLLLAWLLKHPAEICPVVGTTEKGRLQEAIAAEDIELELEDWFELVVASKGHKVP
jgi:predicted oxidoreductase